MSNALSFRKWGAVFNLHMQDSIAYRAQGVIWILADTIPTIALPLMWLAAFGQRETLTGFTREGIVAYYIAMSICVNLIQAHPWEIARDIKDGRLSIYLTRPFSYWGFIFMSNLTWRLMRTLMFLPFLGLILFIFREYLQWGHYNFSAAFWLCLVMAHLLSYQISWVLGCVAFYLVEVGGVYEFQYMIVGLLSGQMAPLALMPAAFQDAARMLPFSYVLSFPVRTLLGQTTHEQIIHGLMMQVTWFAVLAVAGVVIWNHGLKKYTAVGI